MSLRSVVAVALALVVLCRPASGQQAQQLTACRLDGGAGCSPLTTSTGVSATLDLITSTRGSIFYRGASGWVGLAPGTDGMFLRTQGAGANPVWSATAARTDTGNTFTGDQSFGGKFTTYNGLTTDGFGVPPLVKVISRPNETAAIGTTAILASVPAGTYRLAVAYVITTAGSAGTITCTVTWTAGGRALGQAAGTLNANTIDAKTGLVFYIGADASTNISYAVAFAGVTGSPAYTLLIVMERIS